MVQTTPAVQYSDNAQDAQQAQQEEVRFTSEALGFPYQNLGSVL